MTTLDNTLLPRSPVTTLDLRGVDLRHADLREADLFEADLRGADLTGADLSGADLRHADFRGACLYGADLSLANLAFADLRGADLTGVDFQAVSAGMAWIDGKVAPWDRPSDASADIMAVAGGAMECRGTSVPGETELFAPLPERPGAEQEE